MEWWRSMHFREYYIFKRNNNKIIWKFNGFQLWVIFPFRFRHNDETRIIRRVLYVKQELLTLPQHQWMLPVLIGFVFLIFGFLCVVCRSLFVLLSFFFWPLYCLSFFNLRLLMTPLVSFGHCIVCPSSTYGFWWPLWYLLAIVLSVLLQLTASDDPFGIFWPLYCLSFFNSRLLMTSLVSFGHCVVCPSSIYGFWWPSDDPFGIFKLFLDCISWR